MFQKKKFIALEEFLNVLDSFKYTQILISATELKIFSALAKRSLSSHNFAKVAGIDEDGAERLLEALVDMKILLKQGNLYKNSPFADEYLVEGKKSFLGPLIENRKKYLKNWMRLTKILQSGQKNCSSKRSVIYENSNDLENFIKTMDIFGKIYAPLVIEKIDLKGVKRVLDLGAGSGIYSRELLKKNSNIKCIIYDLPQVIRISKKLSTKLKEKSNISFIGGDFIKDPIGYDYDLVLLSHVMHMEDEENNKKLIKKIWEVLNPGGRIAIHDFYLSKNNKCNLLYSSVFLLHMFVTTKRGRIYKEKEYHKLLEEFGFQNIKEYDIPCNLTKTRLVIGSKKSL